MKFTADVTIEFMKKEIEKHHPLKPTPAKQKFLFAGKLLNNTDILRDVIGSVSLKISLKLI